MNGKAFTLIEVLLYAGLGSFFILIVFTFFTQNYRFLMANKMCMQALLDNNLVLDVMRRDIAMLDRIKMAHDLQNGVFHVLNLTKKGEPTDYYVGWQLVQHGVKRTEGVYQLNEHRWVKKTQSFIPCSFGLLQLQCLSHKNEREVAAVIIQYATDNHAAMLQKIVATVNNKVLV
jgi:hypothetical protein